MNHTQLALLTDCAVARHFNTGQTILREGEIANGFYLIETGKVALESRGRLRRIDPNTNRWRRRFARVVMDVSAVRLAIYSTRGRADHCAFFLRGNSAGILREGPLVRLRAVEADQRRDGQSACRLPTTKCCRFILSRVSHEPLILERASSQTESACIG